MEGQGADVSPQQLSKSLMDVAVEAWRFSKLFAKLLSKLDAGEQARYQSQFLWFVKKLSENLEASGLHLVNVEGHPYDPGVAATALNVGDFAPDDRLVVEQMLEPIIMGPAGLLRAGTILVRKVER